MRIIVADIDGVLNSTVSDIINKEEIPHVNIDRHNLEMLKLLVEKSNAKLVISSTWRRSEKYIGNATTEEEIINVFKSYFAKAGWSNAPIIGITPYVNGYRGAEVAKYLQEYSKSNEIDDYLILDDDSDFVLNDIRDESEYRIELFKQNGIELNNQYAYNQRLYLVNKLTGLTFHDVFELMTIINPDDTLVKLHKEYHPYSSNLGVKFKLARN